ncbi:MAG: MCP four helix bundle domain-containing protein [Magnetococcales bacterium]|nr:MCP four helix bundle domain-containing protein [Magnetococcales bacterium]
MSLPSQLLQSLHSSIKVRLRTSFSWIVAIMLAFGLFAILAMRDLADQTTDLFEHPFTVSVALLKIELNASEIRAAMRDLALARGEEEIAPILQHIDGHDNDALRQFDIVAQQFLGDKNRVLKARQLWNEWREIRKDGFQLAIRGDRNQLREFVLRGRGGQHAAAISGEIHDFSSFAANKARSFFEQSQQIRSNSLQISYLFLACCIILTIWFAWNITRSVRAVIVTLTSSTTEIAATVTQHERIATQQSSAINETYTTMEELGSSSRQSAEQAETAAELSRRMMQLTAQGINQVETMEQSMAAMRERVNVIARQILQLSEQTSQIREITGMMADFASETKMLAMNTAIEAVRAGEHGRGFSVLSIETRKLADESKQSARRIDTLVSEIQKTTNATVMAADEGTQTVETSIAAAQQTATLFHEANEAIENLSQNSQQISLNVRQQAVAVRQVVEAMNSLTTGAREAAIGTSQTKERLQTLKEIIQRLVSMI